MTPAVLKLEINRRKRSASRGLDQRTPILWTDRKGGSRARSLEAATLSNRKGRRTSVSTPPQLLGYSSPTSRRRRPAIKAEPRSEIEPRPSMRGFAGVCELTGQDCRCCVRTHCVGLTDRLLDAGKRIDVSRSRTAPTITSELERDELRRPTRQRLPLCLHDEHSGAGTGRPAPPLAKIPCAAGRRASVSSPLATTLPLLVPSSSPLDTTAFEE